MSKHMISGCAYTDASDDSKSELLEAVKHMAFANGWHPVYCRLNGVKGQEVGKLLLLARKPELDISFALPCTSVTPTVPLGLRLCILTRVAPQPSLALRLPRGGLWQFSATILHKASFQNKCFKACVCVSLENPDASNLQTAE